MSGVFLSYSRADRIFAEEIVRGLRALGVDAWWDEDMPGVDWQAELERQISNLAAVVVLWTPVSLNSKNVKDEARLGQQHEKLVNALYGVALPPFPFDRSTGISLNGWDRRDPHTGWTRLVTEIEEHLVRVASIEPGELTNALADRERSALEAKQRAGEAEKVFQTAKIEEDSASRDADKADSSLKHAQEQMRQVMAMRSSAALLRAAQSELEKSIAAKEESDANRSAASERLAGASKQLAKARLELDLLGENASSTATRALQRVTSTSPRGANSRVSRVPTLPEALSAVLPVGGRRTRIWLSLSDLTPFKALFCLVVVVALAIGGWLLVPRTPRPTSPVARAAVPEAGLRVFEAALATPHCSWLQIAKIAPSPTGVDLAVTGVAASPVEVQSALQAASTRANVPIADIDLQSIAAASPTLCSALDALRPFRATTSQTGQNLTAAQDSFAVMKQADGKEAGRAIVTITPPPQGDFAVAQLGADGALSVIAANRQAFQTLAAAGVVVSKVPDADGYRLQADYAKPGWSSVLLISDQGPFPAALLMQPAGPRSAVWASQLATAATAGGWHVEMAWYQIAAGGDLSVIPELRPPTGSTANADLRTQAKVVRGQIDVSSFYSSAVAAGVTDDLIPGFAQAFAYDFDFQREVKLGDVFEAAFEHQANSSGGAFGAGKLLFVSLETQTKSKALYWFAPPSKPGGGWFDSNGRSVIRSLMRTPVDGARIISPFGLRMHPMLGFTKKAHNGTDFAAPVGTPIYAAGDGVVEFSGMKGPNGYFTKILHPNGWETLYMHQSLILPKVVAGAHVTQGQEIGLVGATGIDSAGSATVTGPHLHYEVHIEGVPVDPMSVQVGEGQALTGVDLVAFLKERNRIDALRASQGG